MLILPYVLTFPQKTGQYGILWQPNVYIESVCIVYTKNLTVRSIVFKERSSLLTERQKQLRYIMARRLGL